MSFLLHSKKSREVVEEMIKKHVDRMRKTYSWEGENKQITKEEMPDEARKSLDDAIDHIVSSMNDGELEGLLVKGMEHIDVDENEFETLMIKSILSQSLGFA